MSNSWRSKADILKDLGTVNGRRTGAEHLDQHVVEGERPPPIHHEVPNGDEIKYFSGGNECLSGENANPDLAGISVMLKLVNDMDESIDSNEPITLYHNKSTDEISISKLNPLAGEYVPGGKRSYKRNTLKTPTKVHANAPKKVSEVKGYHTTMFKKREKKMDESNVLESKDSSSVVSNSSDFLESKENNALLNYSSQFKSSSINNELPKQNIDKPQLTNSLRTARNNIDEIKAIQEKIKSTIIASSNSNPLQRKRQKNVAIATLLKMGTIPHITEETPVKLIKPEYFENHLPKEHDVVKKTPSNGKLENEPVPSTSSSEVDLQYIDPDSISKVNDWFNNRESPKPKPQLQQPLVLKDSITFKKKDNLSVTSRTSTTSKPETNEPIKEKKETKNSFKPSSYASDLLKKYESNAQRTAHKAEDLGTMLERQLKERDEQIKQKMLARQNAG